MKIAVFVAAFAVAAGAAAQPDPLVGGPEIRRLGDDSPARAADWRQEMLADPVKALLAAPYLSEDERRGLRIRHGVWKEEDLTSPREAARAALIRGAWGHPALRDPEADAEDAAEAMVFRGEVDASIGELLRERLEAQPPSARAVRLWARTLDALGRREEAVQLLDSVARRVRSVEIESARELVEGVRVLALRAQLAGVDVPGDEYRSMIAMLAQARERLDPLEHDAYLAEAEVLYEKDARAEAAKALEQALGLNPSAAASWRLAGRLAVDQFDIRRADRIARRLDELFFDGGEDESRASGSSPLGALVLGHARLRERDPESAEQLATAALQAAPKSRELSALRAAAAAARFDFVRADALLAEFDALAPGAHEAHLEVGRALSEARQYEEAAAYLAVAAERAPNRAEPFIELGLLSLQAGIDDVAEHALEQATRLDPFNKRAGNSLALVRDLRTFDRIESENFIVRYRAKSDEVLARDMLGPLEEIYRRVCGEERGGIDAHPPRKTLVELLPDHRAFGVRIVGMPALHTIAAATGPVIAMEAPREGANHQGTYDWVRVIRHEFVHTVTLARTRNRLPHWFTEASAVYLEDAPRDWNTVRLLSNAYEADRLFDLDKVNIGFIRPERPTDRPLAYAQSHWMYEFIVERFGSRAPLELMDLYAVGVREGEAFQRVLGLSREEFLAAFKEWAGGELVRWGMRPPPGTPTMKELMEREARPMVEGDAEGEIPEPPVPDEALLAKFLDEHPDHPQVLVAKVQLVLRAAGGDPTPEMIPLLERAARACPMFDLPHKLLARLYLADSSGDPGRAIPHLEWLDAREQKSPALASELARRYGVAGDWSRAWVKARRATQIAPYDPRTRELAATVAIQRRDFDAARHQLEALLLLEPDRELHRQRLEALEALRAQ